MILIVLLLHLLCSVLVFFFFFFFFFSSFLFSRFPFSLLHCAAVSLFEHETLATIEDEFQRLQDRLRMRKEALSQEVAEKVEVRSNKRGGRKEFSKGKG